jgi:uncharacterized coiled-coil protein SlyX
VGNFIKILAASVGGGIMLGAGIRLGEAIATRESGLPAGRKKSEGDRRLADRLGALENRLEDLEVGFDSTSAAVIAARFDTQDSELAAVRAQLKKEQSQVEDLGKTATRLRGELQDWLETSVSTRITEVETRLKTEAERSQQQMLDAFVESVQTRVIRRISGLEEEVSSQSAAMSELRACSLRTEQSMQKLLAELDRVVVRYPSAEPAGPPAQAPAPTEPFMISTTPVVAGPPPGPPAPPSLGEPRRRSKWSIFG